MAKREEGKVVWQRWQVEEEEKKIIKKGRGGLQTAFGYLSKRGMLGSMKSAPGSRCAEQ